MLSDWWLHLTIIGPPEQLEDLVRLLRPLRQTKEVWNLLSLSFYFLASCPSAPRPSPSEKTRPEREKLIKVYFNSWGLNCKKFTNYYQGRSLQQTIIQQCGTPTGTVLLKMPPEKLVFPIKVQNSFFPWYLFIRVYNKKETISFQFM